MFHPGKRASLAACVLLLTACSHQYLDEAEALGIHQAGVPELLNTTPGTIDGDSDGRLDVSGLYFSEGNDFHWTQSNLNHTRLLLRLKQHGNQITAFDSTYRLKLDGFIRDNIIEYYMYPSLVTGNSGLSGTWIVEPGGDLTGRWRTTNYGRVGAWNLRKLHDSGIEFYTTENGMDSPTSLAETDAFFDRLFSRDDDRNIVFYLHGRGRKFSDLFEADGIPAVEAYSNTRFVIVRWLSWADISIRPYNHAVGGADGVAEFLYALNRYKSRFANKIGDRKITLMAHSMGNIPLAVFLQYHYEQDDLQSGLFDSIILNSADMPFENHRQWLEKCDFADRIYVTQHGRDYILKLSRYFFSPEEKTGSFKLGVGLDPDEGDYYEQLAANASYLDLTDLTFTSHKHFSIESTLQLFKSLLNARQVDYPDPSIGLYRKSTRYPVFFFYSSDPGSAEGLTKDFK